jgi:TonB-linked SusC/RagA family outer membrane protein
MQCAKKFRTFEILLVVCLVAGLPAFVQSQYITIDVENVHLKKVMKQVEHYGKYAFAYRTEFIQHATHVSVHVTNGTIHDVMQQALKGLHLNYLIVGNMITVRPDTAAAPAHTADVPTIEGRVTCETGLPIEGASVLDNFLLTGTTTKADGSFKMMGVRQNTVLKISCVGYEPLTVILKDQSFVTIRLKAAVKDLDEAVITGYGKTSKRFNTGSIYKLGQADIARQPVSNTLAVLQGRVPGLLITQSSGLPGAAFKIQLRGQSSIGIVPGQLPANDPLFIIDGVPYAPNNNSVQAISSGTALGESGRSPFSILNIADIEHIEVLKDADATAIYGSRGANGVILITTKRGKPGPPSLNISINSGVSTITRYTNMLNTRQYVQMRKEALQNDGLALNSTTAPDLLSWDTTRYTDFKKLLIGGRAVTNNAQLSLSGGSYRWLYYAGAGYHRETTVFPGSLNEQRGSAHVNFRYASKDTNLLAMLSVIGSYDNNKSILKDLTGLVALAPNVPALYNGDGKLNWQQGDLAFSNPMAVLQQPYEAKTSNLLSNLDLCYRIFKHIYLRGNIGYNRLQSDELSLIPYASQNPHLIALPEGSAYFGKMVLNSWITEPRIEYSQKVGSLKLVGLLGSTLQVQTRNVTNTEATDYASDDQLRNINAAGSLSTNKLHTEYRYGGVFARLNGNWRNTYLLNLTGRTDGSSRFGPGKQVGTFWAAGAGWIFSNESFVKARLPFISFGKLRTSYGITGNDQIGDYKYLDQWKTIAGTYQGTTGITPIQLADSNYSWELNRKFEAALDLGVLNDKLLLSVAYYRNRSSNQLVAYPLPYITGFSSYAAKNSPAVVENTGWEMMLQTKHKLDGGWQVSGNLLLTIPRNKLVAFPNLNASSYASILAIGQPLSVVKGYTYTGVGAATGVFSFADKDANGSISYPKDYGIVGHLGPLWYGGLQTNIQYRGWQLNLFFEYRKQNAYSFLSTVYNGGYPGAMQLNLPVKMLERWQQPGDVTAVQRFTTGENAAAATAISRFQQSNGIVDDASFGRLRNIELSWMFPQCWLHKMCMKNSRLYIQAQNLFTITKYKGVDPESQSLSQLPPLRTIAAGIELNF